MTDRAGNPTHRNTVYNGERGGVCLRERGERRREEGRGEGGSGERGGVGREEERESGEKGREGERKRGGAGREGGRERVSGVSGVRGGEGDIHVVCTPENTQHWPYLTGLLS